MVLLVDDDAVFLEQAERALVQAGIRVLTANSGSRALAAVSAFRDITLVVVDLDLPDIPGMALILELREARPDLEIIAATGVLCKTVLEIAIYFGAKSTLRKPFTGEWISAINNAGQRAVAAGGAA